MKFIFTLIFGFLSTIVLAQNNNIFFEDTVQSINISAIAAYNFGSNAITNQFFNKFTFGGKIDQTLKNNAYKKLSINNRLGGDLSYNFNMELPIDTILGKTNISLVFGAGNTEHIDANFTDDLFKFTFNGNKQFAGKTIDISNFNYNYYLYQQIHFGFINNKKKSGKLAKEGVILSLIKAEEFQAITVPRGSIYTDSLGSEIQLDLNYIYNASDSANTGLSALNGLGISSKLFTEFYLKNGDKIYLSVNDLGFIHWNNKSLEYRTDSTYNYQGIVVNDVFNLNDSLLSSISKDSLKNSIITSKYKNSYSTALPTAININYTKYFNKNLKFNIGIYHKILSNYFPLIYTNTYYTFNKYLVVKAHVSYGGYGKLNTGLALATSFKNRISLYVGSNNIEAFITPKSSYANSGYIGLKAYF